jgi:hypothetical protein
MTKDDQQRQPRHDHSGVHHFLLFAGLAGLALLRKANMLRQAYVAISSMALRRPMIGSLYRDVMRAQRDADVLVNRTPPRPAAKALQK